MKENHISFIRKKIPTWLFYGILAQFILVLQIILALSPLCEILFVRGKVETDLEGWDVAVCKLNIFAPQFLLFSSLKFTPSSIFLAIVLNILIYFCIGALTGLMVSKLGKNVKRVTALSIFLSVVFLILDKGLPIPLIEGSWQVLLFFRLLSSFLPALFFSVLIVKIIERTPKEKLLFGILLITTTLLFYLLSLLRDLHFSFI